MKDIVEYWHACAPRQATLLMILKLSVPQYACSKSEVGYIIVRFKAYSLI